MQINGASNAYYPALDRTAGNGKTSNTTADGQAGNATADSSGGDKPDSAGSTGETDSPVKSFVYGTLGLEHPDQQAQDTDGYYSAGKWLAAALTVGGIISIFV
jgi:hypothetical protein